MIHKVYPLLNDFENLSRLKVEPSDHANNYDYSGVVVNKPWGYEYLWFQNEYVAIWFLFIDSEQKTSMHCHAKKRTSLIVLDGIIECSTIDNRYKLHTLESVVLEPCVFHSSKSIFSKGTILMEIETPPMTGDLIRMYDVYGRQKTAYEKTNEYSRDLHQYEFHPMSEDKYDQWNFRSVQITLTNDLSKLTDQTQLLVSISGNIKKNLNVLLESGEVRHPNNLHIHELKSLTNNQYLIFNSIS